MTQLQAQNLTAPTSMGEDELPHGIRGLWEYPFSLPLWILILLGIAIVAALAFWWFKSRKKEKPTPPPEDPILYLERLLRNMVPPEPFEGKGKRDYFFELNMRFREYLEHTSAVRATDLTLKELREPLRQKCPLARDTVEEILKFLERSELIKFADASTDRNEAEQSHEQVLRWVAYLRPKRLEQGGQGHRI